ncbi:MAG TPA: cyclic nucleotide-binding domain-containing protein [Gaiellaceae bacterium]|nr:cyclic nucleotide-binding domain-containing protein [Gaiellaceae bacterium]
MAAVDALKQVPLLSCLSQRELKRVARNVREQSFTPGTTVIREGKMSGVGFFIVVEGEAEVSAGGAGLGRLHPGDHFGELALIGKRARTATVTAVTPLTCLFMATWDLEELVKSSPETAWKLLRHVVELLAAEQERAGRIASATPG